MISLVINLDSRPGIDGCEGGNMGDGARSWDFFAAGVRNKIQFMEGHRLEIIIYIDQHLPIPNEIIEDIRKLFPNHGTKHQIVVSQHCDGIKNDANYLSAFRLAIDNHV